MAANSLAGVSKRFGAVDVIRDVSLNVESGELVVFLGPSGSGKTTLLRMETIDTGSLTIDGVRSESLPPGQRSVAMVFQNYCPASAPMRRFEVIEHRRVLGSS